MKLLVLLGVAAIGGLAGCGDKAQPPVEVRVHAMVTGVPRAEDVVLVVGDQKVPAKRVERSARPVHVVVLVEGTQQFMTGHASIVSAIDLLARTGGPGSTGTLMTFNSTTVNQYDGPLAELRGSQLGPAGRFDGAPDPDLAFGLVAAHSHLVNGAVPGRHYVVVIASGSATKADQLGNIKKAFEAAGIEVHFLVPGAGEGADHARRLAGQRARLLPTYEALPSGAAVIAERISEETAFSFEIPRAVLARASGTSRAKVVDGVIEAEDRELATVAIAVDRPVQELTGE